MSEGPAQRDDRATTERQPCDEPGGPGNGRQTWVAIAVAAVVIVTAAVVGGVAYRLTTMEWVVEVTIEWPGAAARDVHDLITRPVTGALPAHASVTGATSRDGRCVVYVRSAGHLSPDSLFERIGSAIAGLHDLPADASPPELRLLDPGEATPDLRTIIDHDVLVVVDPAEASRYGLTVPQVIRHVERATAHVDSPSDKLNILKGLRIQAGGAYIPLDHLATITIAERVEQLAIPDRW